VRLFVDAALSLVSVGLAVVCKDLPLLERKQGKRGLENSGRDLVGR